MAKYRSSDRATRVKQLTAKDTPRQREKSTICIKWSYHTYHGLKKIYERERERERDRERDREREECVCVCVCVCDLFTDKQMVHVNFCN